MRALCFAAAALAAVCALSCGPFGAEADLVAVMPEIPAHWAAAFPDLHFRMSFIEQGQEVRSWELPAAAGQVLISCPKAENAAVLAYPECRRAESFLPPAGAVYPLDLVREGGANLLRFSWNAGCEAWILTQLRSLDFDTSLVNATRLREALASHPDPWALDARKIVEELAAGTFSAYDIDSLPSRDVRLQPGAGHWFLEGPAGSVTTCADGDTLLLPALSLGNHALFSIEGGRIRVFVGVKETVVAFGGT